MFGRRSETSQTKHVPATTGHDTVDLSTEELRSISGGNGVSLNLEFEKDADKKGRLPHQKHDGKH